MTNLFYSYAAQGDGAPTTTQSTEQAPTTGVPGAPPTGAKPPGWIEFLPIVGVIVIFYFLMIMPERKNRKKREAMLQAMKKGDRVMTTGGMYAVIAAINDNEITLQIDEGVRARFSRASIQAVIGEEPSAAK